MITLTSQDRASTMNHCVHTKKGSRFLHLDFRAKIDGDPVERIDCNLCTSSAVRARKCRDLLFSSIRDGRVATRSDLNRFLALLQRQCVALETWNHGATEE